MSERQRNLRNKNQVETNQDKNNIDEFIKNIKVEKIKNDKVDEINNEAKINKINEKEKEKEEQKTFLVKVPFPCSHLESNPCSQLSLRAFLCQ